MGLKANSFQLADDGAFYAVGPCPYFLTNNIALTRPDEHNRSLRPSEQKLTPYPQVKRVIYNDPATIVLWDDGTKSVVKCMDGEPFEKFAGFCAALAKKVFGSTSKAKKVCGAKEKHVKIETEESVDEELVADETVVEFQYIE